MKAENKIVVVGRAYNGTDLYISVKVGKSVQACRVYEDAEKTMHIYYGPKAHYVAVVDGRPCLDLEGNPMMFGRASVALHVAEQISAIAA